MSEPSTAAPVELTIDEAAEYARLKPSWLYEKVKYIPHIKVAGRIFLRKHDVDAFLESHAVSPQLRD